MLDTIKLFELTKIGEQVVAELLTADGVDLDPVNNLRDEVSLSGLETIHTQQSVEFSVQPGNQSVIGQLIVILSCDWPVVSIMIEY